MGFFGQLVQIQNLIKDSKVKAVISKLVAQQPNAAYLLVQDDGPSWT